VVVERNKAAADIIKETVGKESAIVQLAVDEANVIRQDCQNDLDAAMPLLKKCEDALKVLDANQINTVRKFASPPKVVQVVMKACCLLLYPNPKEKKKDEATMKMEISWWDASVKLLNDDFLKKLQEYDKENIEEKLILSLGKFLQAEENQQFLKLEIVRNASSACECIFLWLTAIYDFYWTNKKIKPKIALKKEADTKVADMQTKLAVSQAKLKVAVDEVQALDDDLNITLNKKNALERDFNLCTV